VTSAEYLAGALLLGFELGCAALVATLVVSRRAGAGLIGVPRLLAWMLIAATFVFAVHLIPGVLGVLEPAAVITTALLLVGLAAAVPDRLVRPPSPREPRPQKESRIGVWLGLGASAAVTAYLVGWGLEHGGTAIAQTDVVSFHLPNVARWIQEGSLWGIHDWIPGRAPGNYPQTGDLFMLATVLPWDSDFVVRFAGYPFVALAGLAVFAACRELAVPRGTAALVGAGAIAIPAVSYITIAGLADPEMYGLFAAGAYFLLRHWRTGDRFDLLLAGIGLGLAFGTRWYAVPAVLAVLAGWAVVLLADRRRREGSLANAGLLAGLIAGLGGFWLLRNWVESGNPVFPVRVAPLGIEIFDAPRDPFRERYGFTLAHYLTDPGVLRTYIWPRFLEFLSFTAIGLWIAAVLGVLLGWRERLGPRGADARRALVLSGVALVIGLVYLGTPYTGSGPEGVPFDAWVNSRYVVPALLVAAPVLGWLITRAGALREPLQVLAALAIADSMRRIFELPGGSVGAGWLLLALAVVALVAFVSLVVRDSAADLPAGRRRALATALVAGAVGVIAIGAGAVQRHRYEPDRYANVSPVVDYVNSQAPAQLRVGIVGDGFANYPLFGPRLDNRVSYVGHRVDEMLSAFRNRRAFIRALHRGRYQVIAWRSVDTLHKGLPKRQAKWLERAGYRRVAEGHDSLLNAEVALYLPRPPHIAPLF
jgi:hypothetical protein